MNIVPKRPKVSWWVKALPLFIFLALWQAIVPHIQYGTYFYGSPDLIRGALVDQAKSGLLWTNFWNTVLAVLVGFTLGNAAGIIAGLVFAYYPRVASICQPYLTAVACVPIIAFAPIILLIFGTQFLPKIVLAGFSTFAIAAGQTFEGALQAEPSSIALLESLGANRLTVYRKVVIPSSLVWFFSGLRLNVGAAILAVFTAEFITSHPGVGYQIIVDAGLFKTSSVLAGVTVIAVLSLVLTGLIGLLQKHFSQWRRSE